MIVRSDRVREVRGSVGKHCHSVSVVAGWLLPMLLLGTTATSAECGAAPRSAEKAREAKQNPISVLCSIPN